MFSGAKWWKFDFHVHTPSSSDYGEPQISCRDFLLSVMNSGVNCIAITDHNNCNWVTSLQNELVTMKSENIEGFRDIVIFPGVEVEVFSAVHLLGLFDPNKPIDEINALIACVMNSGNTLKINEAINAIQRNNGIAIPAHVNKEKGLFSSLQGSSIKSVLDNCDFFAVEVTDPGYSLPQICGDMKREFTYIMGSDAHCRDDIGKRYSWVKMSSPTIESLALALQDSLDGVVVDGSSLDNPNSIENRCYIEELCVMNGKKIGNGNALVVHFSPWLNTIIGGRGSGKTAITEFLRIIFNKTQNLPTEIKNTYRKFAKIPSDRTDVGMLRSETEIEVLVVKDGRRLKLKWRSNQWEEYVESDTGWQLSDTVGNVEQRFPVSIYSQKQLFEMAEEPNCLIQFIDQLFHFTEWNQQLADYIREYKALCSESRELTIKLARESTFRAELSDLDARILMMESSINNPVISTVKNYSSQYSECKSELSTIVQRLSAMLDDIPAVTLVDESKIESVFNEEFITKYKSLRSDWSILLLDYSGLQERISTMKAKAEEILTNHTCSQSFNNAKQQYDQVISELQIRGIDNLEELPSLYTRRDELNKQIENMLSWRCQLSEIQQKTSEQYDKIILHQKLLRDMRMHIINQLNSDQVKITLLPMQDSIQAEREFRAIIRKETQFQADIFNPDNLQNSFIGKLCSFTGDAWTNRKQVVDQFFDPERREIQYGKRFSDYITSLHEEHPEDIDMLYVWIPPDTIKLEIQMNGRFSNIEQGSAGQKTTALLSLILRSTNGPLVIDQPEDDLDTKLISELLVTELRNIKKKHQIIVITHNPNIPVNGAAEQILAMNFVSGQINCKVEGALQSHAIRNEICDIMEGGREALKNRYMRIYKPLCN